MTAPTWSPVDEHTSTDTEGRNAGRPIRAYVLATDTRPAGGEATASG